MRSDEAMPKLLLIEDNEMNRDMLSRRLERRGFEVVVAADGRRGIRNAETWLPDLVIMDLDVPEIDGIEATRILKSSPATSEIPILVLTAHALVSDREKAFEAGCDDFATKPVEFDQLMVKINSLLTQKVRVS